MTTIDKPRSRTNLPTDIVDRYWCGEVRADRQTMCQLMDSIIRAGVQKRRSRSEPVGREWALVDTRGSDPGAYLIRAWTDASGVSKPVELPPRRRYGGAIGLYTLENACIASGQVSPGVDEGAGLLLVGFESMVALPLPAQAWEVLGANWVVVLSGQPGGFSDAEIHRLFLLTWAILYDESSGCAITRGASPGPRAFAPQTKKSATRRPLSR